ncbi:MAG: AAA family ATPase [Candidatus Shapirobacteria bacterium]|nr:AAA family ATPase [Candidatus Shapirobacteria bacterium]
MDNLAPLISEVNELEKKINSVNLPPELKDKSLQMIQRLGRMVRYGEYSTEYEKTAHYLDWITNLPWQKRSEDILDLINAKKVLDSNHYGLGEIKERLLEYLSVLSLRKNKSEVQRAPILCFVGLVGTGKTTIASSIAQAMGRKFARVPFGGLGDPLDLRGQSRLRPDAEPGLIIKALRRVGTKNPVILLDEIDRVTDEGRSSVMGVLVELLDPEQNKTFQDHFIDYPFDLSEVLFITTCNNIGSISTAVMDRLEPIQMPSYTDEEKINIGKNYVLPKVLKENGLNAETVKIDQEVWAKIVRPLGYDAGIRTLERTIDGICRKIAKMVIEGKGKSFSLNNENIKEFLPTW